jgi:hypothetical protein
VSKVVGLTVQHGLHGSGGLRAAQTSYLQSDMIIFHFYEPASTGKIAISSVRHWASSHIFIMLAAMK